MASITQGMAFASCPASNGTFTVTVTFDDITGVVSTINAVNTSTVYSACVKLFLNGVLQATLTFNPGTNLSQSVIGVTMVQAADGTWDFNFPIGVGWSAG